MAVSKPLNPLNLNPHYFVVAAIDFGTTFSGYAFSFDSNIHGIHMNKRWGSPTGRESDKCPTSVLLTSDGRFHSFGYEAEDDYLQFDSDAGYQLYRNFKMVLYDEVWNILCYFCSEYIGKCIGPDPQIKFSLLPLSWEN